MTTTAEARRLSRPRLFKTCPPSEPVWGSWENILKWMLGLQHINVSPASKGFPLWPPSPLHPPPACALPHGATSCRDYAA
jgi:hypothetical protein